ncbi:MAG: chromophore lyase CpcT/CpeT [Acidobacteria bacterium]|nr:chromophore lyase CpcT/CpeT [Acidobacteriota bacterium]MCB9397745.1 chromophore lyase CpcT/CpeT [Acidobacteriota bacterium]
MVWLLLLFPSADPELETFVAWLSGTFSSTEQAKADPDFYDIHLVMAPIWTDRTDGYWFYVEQAVATSLEKPYRQRVYHVSRLENGQIESAVYTLKDPQTYVGAGQEPQRFDALSPNDLEVREGCAVIMHREPDGSFKGGTQENHCASNLRGASYATSEITLSENLLISWDRGFADNGEQVWGAQKGGYHFKRLN